MRNYNKELKYRELYGYIYPMNFITPNMQPVLIVGVFLEYFFSYFQYIRNTAIAIVFVFLAGHIFKEMFLKGNINAYYRRTQGFYGKVLNRFNFLGMFTTGLFLASIPGAYIKSQRDLFEFTSYYIPTQFNYSIFIVLFYAALIYMNFYNDKYISAKEYSDRYNYYSKGYFEKDLSIDSKIKKEKDAEYNVKNYHGYYFDEASVAFDDIAKNTDKPMTNQEYKEIRRRQRN